MKISTKNSSITETQKKAKLLILALAVIFLAGAVFFGLKYGGKPSGLFFSDEDRKEPQKKQFEDNFQEKRTIEEASKISKSTDPDWWVNSGGLMETGDGTGRTIQGELPVESEWFEKYDASNPRDTDGGVHPQNIFRLVKSKKWQNFRQEAYFKINAVNLSESENRNESNGLLLFNRYQDGDNLYYTGVRVDGSVVIKKKYDGEYYTLAEKRYFPGEKYDRDSNPNLIPAGKWIGLKSEVENTDDGNVEIRLFMSEEKKGDWRLALKVTDDGRKEFGEDIISDEGYAGIRTDFMDVEFADYSIVEF